MSTNKRKYVCKSRCKAFARRKDYKKCSGCASASSSRGYCHFHEKYIPHYSANKNINKEYSDMFMDQDFFNPNLQTYILRVIKDSTRITQVPLITDYTQVRVDPRMPYVVYIVFDKPPNAPDSNDRFPLRFILTNVYRLIPKKPDEPANLVSSVYYNKDKKSLETIAFDVLSTNFKPSEYSYMVHRFWEFFIKYGGMQIFNCQIGRQNVVFNFRLLPLIMSTLSSHLNSIMPLYDLCVVKYLAQKAQRIYTNLKNMVVNEVKLSFRETFFLVQFRLDLLHDSLFKRRKFPIALKNISEMRDIDESLYASFVKIANIYNDHNLNIFQKLYVSENYTINQDLLPLDIIAQLSNYEHEIYTKHNLYMSAIYNNYKKKPNEPIAELDVLIFNDEKYANNEPDTEAFNRMIDGLLGEMSLEGHPPDATQSVSENPNDLAGLLDLNDGELARILQEASQN